MNKYRLSYFVSEVSDGNMSYRFGDSSSVTQNRDIFFAKSSMSYKDSIWMAVQHGAAYEVVGQKQRGFGARNDKTALEVDCLVTTESGLPLSLLTADCIPVILFSPEVPLVALVHLGWKNVDEYFIQNILKYLRERYQVTPDQFQVFMGPHISDKSYCVLNPAQLNRDDWLAYIKKVETKFFIDISGFAQQQMLDLGVTRENITISKIDTYASKKYFSHKRSHLTGVDNGRFVSVVQINEINS